MLFSPIGIWVRGLLLALAVFALGVYLLTRWHDALPTEQPVEPHVEPTSDTARTAARSPNVASGCPPGGSAGTRRPRFWPALVPTRYTNPVHTAVPTWLLPAIQKPVLEPLCWLTVALSPVAWLMNLLGYLNGSAHWSNHSSMFAGIETKGQLEFVTRYILKQSPTVIARRTLGMSRYDATGVIGPA